VTSVTTLSAVLSVLPARSLAVTVMVWLPLVSWSLTLTPAQLATFTSGSHTITVTASDLAGNTDSVLPARSLAVTVMVWLPLVKVASCAGVSVSDQLPVWRRCAQCG
jgi:hypothetical protein